jgi:hypothetical protein
MKLRHISAFSLIHVKATSYWSEMQAEAKEGVSTLTMSGCKVTMMLHTKMPGTDEHLNFLDIWCSLFHTISKAADLDTEGTQASYNTCLVL